MASRWWFIATTLVLLYYYFASSNSSLSIKTRVGRGARPATKLWQPKKWTQRIVAVGDLHGDLPQASKVLRMAGVVDHRNRWIGKTTILGVLRSVWRGKSGSLVWMCTVQTGDIVDRGKDTIALYHLFDNLRAEAAKAGGAVISLLGNHELMYASLSLALVLC